MFRVLICLAVLVSYSGKIYFSFLTCINPHLASFLILKQFNHIIFSFILVNNLKDAYLLRSLKIIQLFFPSFHRPHYFLCVCCFVVLRAFVSRM